MVPGLMRRYRGKREGEGRKGTGVLVPPLFCPTPCADPKAFSACGPPSAELFVTPVLRVMGSQEARAAPHGRVVLRCETRLHPQKRGTPLQFAFYKYSRPVRRFDWGAEYTVPEPEVEELESYWCEAATATRSVRKRSPWLQLPGPGE